MLKQPVCDSAVGGCDRPVGKAIYAIDAFPDDAQLWRDDRLEARAIDNNKAPRGLAGDQMGLKESAGADLPLPNRQTRGQRVYCSLERRRRLWILPCVVLFGIPRYAF
jgi:hypothetical protein